MTQPSSRLPAWKRAVVKVGSNLIAPEGRGLATRYLLDIAAFIGDCRGAGRELVLVSSGAVAAGRALLVQREPARVSLVAKQALAAIGQVRMMETWAKLIDGPAAQVLLTYDDLGNRRRFVNAKNTLRELLRLGVLPVVNENDSVAVDELRLGDNDNLAAHVAVLIDADLLIILSDVDGLFDADPRKHTGARLIAEVPLIDAGIHALAGAAGSTVGTGGMRTKIEAAEKAGRRGITTLIAHGGKPETFARLRRNENPGTLLHPGLTAQTARAHWLQHALAVQGALLVDAGAARALRERGASLLPPGVVDVRGNFRAGDAVEVISADTEVGCESRIARGVSQYDAAELRRIKGRSSREIEALLGYVGSDEAIHRDDLVLL